MSTNILKLLLCSTSFVITVFAKDHSPMMPHVLPPQDVASFPVNPLARYGLPEAAKIWSDQTRFQIYYQIEGYINEALAKAGIIPRHVVDHYWAIKEFSIDKIREHEKTTHHEFLAFLATIGDHLGEDAKSVHYGITSSNVLDTGFNVQLDQSLDLIHQELTALLEALKQRALEHKTTLCMGRTHGMHAEPMSFGLKLLRHYAAFKRHQQSLKEAQEGIRICAIGGALGNFVNISPEVEGYVAQKLNFKVEPIATQVIPRDRYGKVFATLSLLASSIEDLATEIRHSQRSEVGEVQEPFKEGQKGSSAMPHKRNPIKCENLVGIARTIRSTLTPALENMALWHERDMSHSSVERFIAPTGTILTHYALTTLKNIVSGLVVHKERMQRNIDQSCNVFASQRIMLALVNKGMSRDEAYKYIQQLAHQALDQRADFKQILEQNSEIKQKLSEQEIQTLFDQNYYLKNVETLFDRVLTSS